MRKYNGNKHDLTDIGNVLSRVINDPMIQTIRSGKLERWVL